MSDEKVRTIKLKELLLELELTEGLIKSYPLSSTIVNLTRMSIIEKQITLSSI